MAQDYSSYLPHIDVKDGMARVINNKQLYVRLLGKFKGQEMVAGLVEHANGGDAEKAMHAAHAIKGTAANLGFPVMCRAAGEVEEAAKRGEDAAPLLPALYEALHGLQLEIDRFLAENQN